MLCQIEHVGPVRAAKMKTTTSTCMTVTSKAPAPMDYSPKERHIFGEYTLHCRPLMQFFLGGMVKRFRLIISTRLPSSVAKLVVDFIFRSLYADLYDVLTLEDCTCIVERRPSWMCKCRPPPDLLNVSCIAHPAHLLVDKTVKEDTFVAFPEHPGSWLYLKVLHKVVWEEERFANRDFKCNVSNTLLIDSSLESSLLNPVHNAIFPLTYIASEFDIGLNSLASYLKGLVDSGHSVPQYLLENPSFFRQVIVPLSQTYLGLKVRVLAPWQDKSLVLEYPFVVGDYNRVEYFNSRVKKPHLQWKY